MSPTPRPSSGARPQWQASKDLEVYLDGLYTEFSSARPDYGPAFAGKPRPTRGMIPGEHEGNCAGRDGKWKRVSRFPDAGELYDIDAVRAQSDDLIDREPDPVIRLSAAYEGWAKRVGAQARMISATWLRENRSLATRCLGILICPKPPKPPLDHGPRVSSVVAYLLPVCVRYYAAVIWKFRRSVSKPDGPGIATIARSRMRGPGARLTMVLPEPSSVTRSSPTAITAPRNDPGA
jgi:hypothetical protein